MKRQPEPEPELPATQPAPLSPAAQPDSEAWHGEPAIDDDGAGTEVEFHDVPQFDNEVAYHFEQDVYDDEVGAGEYHQGAYEQEQEWDGGDWGEQERKRGLSTEGEERDRKRHNFDEVSAAL